MQTQICPTIDTPIFVLTRSSKTHHHFTKYWHHIARPYPHERLEEIYSSTCKIPAAGSPTKSIAFAKEYSNLHELNWSKPKVISPLNTSVALVFYNQETNQISFPSVKEWVAMQHSPQSETVQEAACAFANNPAHIFTLHQAKSVHKILSYPVSINPYVYQPASNYQPFLTLWPYINENQYSKFTYPETRTPSNSFPKSFEDAAQVFENAVHQPNQHPQPNKQTSSGPSAQQTPLPEPIPFHITNQPTPTAPLLIPNITFRNTRHPTLKQPPTQNHHIWLHVTPEGPTNKRREVFYAKPHPTTSIGAYPISPLKASVAILFCNLVDSQPLIKSINTHEATQLEKDKFLAKYRQYMNAEQLREFKPADAIAPNSKNCLECGTNFVPLRSSAKFCSHFCRIDYHSKLRKMSFEEKQESNRQRSINTIGRPRRKPVTAAEVASTFTRFTIRFPDGTYYRGPDRTETSLVHNAGNRDFQHFAKTYPESMAQSIVNDFPVVFAGCTIEKVESDA